MTNDYSILELVTESAELDLSFDKTGCLLILVFETNRKSFNDIQIKNKSISYFGSCAMKDCAISLYASFVMLLLVKKESRMFT